MKIIRRTITIILLILILITGYIIYSGWNMYKEVTEEVSVTQKIEQIKSQEHYTKYEDLSKTYVNAVIAGEDKRFRKHGGVDIISTGRAILRNVKEKDLVEGGSTITQQLARNMYFDQDKKLTRKVAEIFVAFEIERECDKNEILELYANVI